MKIKKRQLWIVPLLGLTLWNPAALAGDSLTGNSAREQRQESLQQLEPENWKSGIPEYSLKKALERASWWGDETDSECPSTKKSKSCPTSFGI